MLNSRPRICSTLLSTPDLTPVSKPTLILVVYLYHNQALAMSSRPRFASIATRPQLVGLRGHSIPGLLKTLKSTWVPTPRSTRRTPRLPVMTWSNKHKTPMLQPPSLAAPTMLLSQIISLSKLTPQRIPPLTRGLTATSRTTLIATEFPTIRVLPPTSSAQQQRSSTITSNMVRQAHLAQSLPSSKKASTGFSLKPALVLLLHPHTLLVRPHLLPARPPTALPA